VATPAQNPALNAQASGNASVAGNVGG
jgi:hypothetical protein